MQQDLANAIELWLKAGELGFAQAYYILGFSYEGTGVTIDKKKAKHYYELAAINGNVHQGTILLLLYRGKETPT